MHRLQGSTSKSTPAPTPQRGSRHQAAEKEKKKKADNKPKIKTEKGKTAFLNRVTTVLTYLIYVLSTIFLFFLLLPVGLSPLTSTPLPLSIYRQVQSQSVKAIVRRGSGGQRRSGSLSELSWFLIRSQRIVLAPHRERPLCTYIDVVQHKLEQWKITQSISLIRNYRKPSAFCLLFPPFHRPSSPSSLPPSTFHLLFLGCFPFS